jgi:hypothetical protein
VPTFPGQPTPQILDQLAQQMLVRAQSDNLYNYLPMIDENGIEVFHAPSAQVEFQSFDPGLQFHVDTWADFDKDNDVDTADFAAFGQCFSGAGVEAPPPPTCSVHADFDNDGDVDTGDFASFAQCYGGSGMSPAPGCALQ